MTTGTVSDDMEEIDINITHAQIDILYRSMSEQICGLVIDQGGVMPQESEFTIERHGELTTEAYVPDAQSFEEYVKEYVDGMNIYYLGDAEDDELAEAIKEMDEGDGPGSKYQVFDWIDLEVRDDYDRVSIEWDPDE